MGRRSSRRARRAASPKIARRRRSVRLERFTRHRRLWLAGLLVAGLGTGGWFLANSRLFALGGVDVRGNKLLDREAVVSVSGLKVGMNLLRVDAGAIERSLENLAVVADAHVERLYPSRVRITLRERVPAVLVETVTGAWFAGADGRLITPALAAPPGLPRIVVDAPAGSPELTEALRLWNAVSKDMRARITRVEAAEPGALALIVDGVRVIFGEADRVDAKLRAASAVLARAAARGSRVRQIDVRVPRRPAARMA